MSIKSPRRLSQKSFFLYQQRVISSSIFQFFVLGSFLLIFGFEALINPAHAYIGPGLGIGSLMIIVGIGLSILLAIVAIFWYPIKRMIFGRAEESEDDDDDEDDDEEDH